MNRESRRIPKLVNITNNNNNTNTNNNTNFFSLNVVVLIIFIGFFFFFLFNCRNGIFENIDLEPIPYSLK